MQTLCDDVASDSEAESEDDNESLERNHLDYDIDSEYELSDHDELHVEATASRIPYLFGKDGIK